MMEKERIYIEINFKAFYVSVECKEQNLRRS